MLDYSDEGRENSTWFTDFYLTYELTDLRKDPNYIRSGTRFSRNDNNKKQLYNYFTVRPFLTLCTVSIQVFLASHLIEKTNS